MVTNFTSYPAWNNPYDPWTRVTTISLSSNYITGLGTTTNFNLSVFNPTTAVAQNPFPGYFNLKQMFVCENNPDYVLYFWEYVSGDISYQEWYFENMTTGAWDASISYAVNITTGSRVGYPGVGREVPFCNFNSAVANGGSGAGAGDLGWVTGGASNFIIVKPVTTARWEKRRKRLLGYK